MAIYQLNGLNLPRSSEEQYRAGIPVKQSQLLRGDLVFFATSTGKKISHVGVYAGDNKFIHAPGRGKRIRADSLSNRYFKTRYAGARTYL
jgi:cell wall-associated NlpC family hydrolase